MRYRMIKNGAAAALVLLLSSSLTETVGSMPLLHRRNIECTGISCQRLASDSVAPSCVGPECAPRIKCIGDVCTEVVVKNTPLQSALVTPTVKNLSTPMPLTQPHNRDVTKICVGEDCPRNCQGDTCKCTGSDCTYVLVNDMSDHSHDQHIQNESVPVSSKPVTPASKSPKLKTPHDHPEVAISPLPLEQTPHISVANTPLQSGYTPSSSKIPPIPSLILLDAFPHQLADAPIKPVNKGLSTQVTKAAPIANAGNPFTTPQPHSAPQVTQPISKVAQNAPKQAPASLENTWAPTNPALIASKQPAVSLENPYNIHSAPNVRPSTPPYTQFQRNHASTSPHIPDDFDDLDDSNDESGLPRFYPAPPQQRKKKCVSKSGKRKAKISAADNSIAITPQSKVPAITESVSEKAVTVNGPPSQSSVVQNESNVGKYYVPHTAPAFASKDSAYFTTQNNAKEVVITKRSNDDSTVMMCSNETCGRVASKAEPDLVVPVSKAHHEIPVRHHHYVIEEEEDLPSYIPVEAVRKHRGVSKLPPVVLAPEAAPFLPEALVQAPYNPSPARQNQPQAYQPAPVQYAPQPQAQAPQQYAPQPQDIEEQQFYTCQDDSCYYVPQDSYYYYAQQQAPQPQVYYQPQPVAQQYSNPAAQYGSPATQYGNPAVQYVPAPVALSDPNIAATLAQKYFS